MDFYAMNFDVHNIGGYVCHLRLFGTMWKQALQKMRF